MSTTTQVAKQMEMFALKKWESTLAQIELFSKQAEENMKDGAPGPETGLLDKAIKSEFYPGSFVATVVTKIEAKDYPEGKYRNGNYTTAQVGFFWNEGHYNIFLRRSVPPWYFMENGSKEAYAVLTSRLNGIWGGNK